MLVVDESMHGPKKLLEEGDGRDPLLIVGEHSNIGPTRLPGVLGPTMLPGVLLVATQPLLAYLVEATFVDRFRVLHSRRS